MMKKILPLVLVAVLVVAAAAGLFYFKGMHKEQEALLDFVPDNALMYTNQKDLGTVLDELKKSRLGQTFKQIDFVQVAKDLHHSDEEVANIQQVLEKGSAFFDGPVFKELLSKDVAIALFPMDVALMQDPGESVVNNLLLVARPEHSAQLLGLLATALGNKVNQTDFPYGTYTVKRLKEEGGPDVFAVVVNDIVLISFGEQTIHDAIDCYAKKKKSLAVNPNFQKLMDGINPNPRFFSYLNLEGIKNQATQILSKFHKDDEGMMGKDFQKQLLTQWNGLQAMGYGTWTEANALRSKVIVLIDNAKIDPALKDFYVIPAEKNPSLVYAPEHTLAYYWTNTLSLPLYWKLFQAKTDFSQDMVDDIHKTAKEQLGMELEDFLGLFDKQMTVLIQNTNEKRPFPIPDFSILVRLKDGNRFNALFQNLLAKNGLRIQVNDYKGIGIKSLMDIPASAGVAPVFAITETYFMVATSQAYMKQMIDSMKEDHGLVETPGFKSVYAGMLEENNTVTYLRVDEFVSLLKILAKKYGESGMSDEGEEGVAKSQILLERVVNPLLDSLTMYSDIGGHGKLIPGQAIFETTTVMKK